MTKYKPITTLPKLSFRTLIKYWDKEQLESLKEAYTGPNNELFYEYLAEEDIPEEGYFWFDQGDTNKYWATYHRGALDEVRSFDTLFQEVYENNIDKFPSVSELNTLDEGNPSKELLDYMEENHVFILLDVIEDVKRRGKNVYLLPTTGNLISPLNFKTSYSELGPFELSALKQVWVEKYREELERKGYSVDAGASDSTGVSRSSWLIRG